MAEYVPPFNSTDPDAPFVNGNPSAGIEGSIPDGTMYEVWQRELVYAIAQSGQDPTNDDLTQVWQAMQRSASTVVVNNYAKGSLIGRRVYSTPGTITYTPTAGTKKLRVTVVGAGGGGGGVQATSSGQFGVGGGGGGGGCAISDLFSGFSGVLITVGAGGLGGTGSTAGGTGGTSSFGPLLAATGGLGGTETKPNTSTVVQAGGSGGTATGGTVTNGVGGSGANGVGTSIVNVAAGQGGDSALGSGASAVFSTNAAGLPASSPGSGGGGAVNLSNQPVFFGGVGAPGAVVVEEYA